MLLRLAFLALFCLLSAGCAHGPTPQTTYRSCSQCAGASGDLSCVHPDGTTSSCEPATR